MGSNRFLQQFRELLDNDLAIPEDLVEETWTDGLA